LTEYGIKLSLRYSSKKDANLVDELLVRGKNDVNLLKYKSIFVFKDIWAGRKINGINSASEQQI